MNSRNTILNNEIINNTNSNSNQIIVNNHESSLNEMTNLNFNFISDENLDGNNEYDLESRNFDNDLVEIFQNLTYLINTERYYI